MAPGQKRESQSRPQSFTGEVLPEIPQADRDDLETAYRTAARAQKDWGAALPGERAFSIHRIAS
jgi:aldehyde dehydrogenase (NAD+)